MKYLVFTYGTLKRGHRNNRLLATAEFVGEAEAAGWVLVDLGWFPGMVRDLQATNPVRGELWHVDQQTLDQLDRLEGTPTLYVRRQIVLSKTPPGSDIQKAWTYIYNQSIDGRDRIESGEWTKGALQCVD